MKKRLLLIVALAIATISYSREIKWGGGLVLGSEISIDDDLDEEFGLGLNVKAEYVIDSKLSAVGGFTLYFPSEPKGVDLTAWQICADAHYKFIEKQEIEVYGIGGINLSYMDIDLNNSNIRLKGDGSELGLDLGVGTNINMFFGELKYDTAFDQIQFTFGLNF
jgi:opacity protein-like surface antigen